MSLLGTATSPRPAYKQVGAAPGKAGPQPGWLLVGTQAGGQKEPSAQLRPPKEGECPAPSRGTVPWPTPLPAREPGQAQDTRDPGPAVPRRQEHPLAQEPGWRATLRPRGPRPHCLPGANLPAGTPSLLSKLTLRPGHGPQGQGEGRTRRQPRQRGHRASDEQIPTDPVSPPLGSGHLPTAPASHQGQSST